MSEEERESFFANAILVLFDFLLEAIISSKKFLFLHCPQK
jgi:hypothetical protein